MENNTFATTVYAQTPAPRAFDYLRRLQNLDEWTLGSRMVTRIDDDTFMGTASGYQTMLCYHVRTLEHPRFAAIEWQCGYRYREYFKQYPVFVFPSRYADPRGDEDGSYIHWISVIDPARRTEMIMQGIAAVHHYEGRGLKAALERREGLDAARAGRSSVLSDTMWVDAPIEMARELLADRDGPRRLGAAVPRRRRRGRVVRRRVRAPRRGRVRRLRPRRLRAGRAGLRVSRSRCDAALPDRAGAVRARLRPGGARVPAPPDRVRPQRRVAGATAARRPPS